MDPTKLRALLARVASGDVNVDAAVLRLVIHKCHVNKLNIYNQVGIVALNVIGEPIAPMDNGLGGGGYDGLAPGPRPPRHAGVADMSLDLDVDPDDGGDQHNNHELLSVRQLAVRLGRWHGRGYGCELAYGGELAVVVLVTAVVGVGLGALAHDALGRSEEHTSELQSP